MSRFYAQIQGNRGEASRMGDKSSGIYGHVRGWQIGARVDMDAAGEEDICTVRITTGSNGWGNGEALGSFERSPDGSIIWKPTLAVVNRLLKAHGRKPITDDQPSSVRLYD